MLLPLVAAGTCWLAGSSEAVERWTVGPAAVLAAIGYGLIVWEFYVVPVRNDVRRAQGKSQDELD